MISEGQRRLGPAQSIRFAADGSPGEVAPPGPESRSVWSAVPRGTALGWTKPSRANPPTPCHPVPPDSAGSGRRTPKPGGRSGAARVRTTRRANGHARYFGGDMSRAASSCSAAAISSHDGTCQT